MPAYPSRVRVCTAAEARALDEQCVATGIPGVALMQRAGAAAATELARRHAPALRRGMLILAGPGNNGGDGWVVARALTAAGIDVRVWEAEQSRTPDAAAERSRALADGVTLLQSLRFAGEGMVVDALLGTGATGELRGAIADGARCLANARVRGAIVVALDMPTGVDATTGVMADASLAVHAHLTLTFGTLKRGHLIARDACGQIVVLDIGLPAAQADAPSLRAGGNDAGLARRRAFPYLVDRAAALALLPPIGIDAHKGSKGRIAIVGGGAGMAGAVVLAAGGALCAGAGLVKVFADASSLAAVRAAVPQALTGALPDGDDADAVHELAAWADAVAIGPGLGTSAASRRLVEQILGVGDAPVVLDADALNVFAGDREALGRAIGSRRVLVTPHALEMARLTGARDAQQVLDDRYDAGAIFASETGATVLLKGVPTVISSPDGRRLVTATGTTALATGGSGDVLTGMAATLLAQMDDVLHAGAVAAWAHGRAAEIASDRAGSARGVPLATVLAEVAHTVWGEPARHHVYPVLCELP